MNTTAAVFEIEPFRHEFEAGRHLPSGGRSRSRGRTKASKPWPSFRKRRILRTPSIYAGRGGYWPAPGSGPQAEPEPTSAGSPEYIRWLQSTLNRATGATLPIDGVMSEDVRGAIRDFQRKNGLPVSGYVGPDTDAALRSASAGSESGEFELESAFELSSDALAVDAALSPRNARPVPNALRSLGKQPGPGLYRFFTADGRFYTGMSMDLRRRILENLWCLSHLNVQTRNYRLVFCRMPDKTKSKIRSIEEAINKHHENDGLSLNKTAELEFLELSNI